MVRGVEGWIAAQEDEEMWSLLIIVQWHPGGPGFGWCGLVQRIHKSHEAQADVVAHEVRRGMLQVFWALESAGAGTPAGVTAVCPPAQPESTAQAGFSSVAFGNV